MEEEEGKKSTLNSLVENNFCWVKKIAVGMKNVSTKTVKNGQPKADSGAKRSRFKGGLFSRGRFLHPPSPLFPPSINAFPWLSLPPPPNPTCSFPPPPPSNPIQSRKPYLTFWWHRDWLAPPHGYKVGRYRIRKRRGKKGHLWRYTAKDSTENVSGKRLFSQVTRTNYALSKESKAMLCINFIWIFHMSTKTRRIFALSPLPPPVAHVCAQEAERWTSQILPRREGGGELVWVGFWLSPPP